jgi:hypothetical protein
LLLRLCTLLQVGHLHGGQCLLAPAIDATPLRQGDAFAKALLKRNKTDAVDAQTLAPLGALLQPARWTPPPAIYTQV